MGINPVNDKRILSLSLIMSCPPTAPVPSWLCRPRYRDCEFAKNFDLPIIGVVKGNTESIWTGCASPYRCYHRYAGQLGFLDNLSVTDAKRKRWSVAGSFNGKGCDGE